MCKKTPLSTEKLFPDGVYYFSLPSRNLHLTHSQKRSDIRLCLSAEIPQPDNLPVVSLQRGNDLPEGHQIHQRFIKALRGNVLLEFLAVAFRCQ